MKKTLLFWTLFVGIIIFAGCSENLHYSFAEQSCKENSWSLIKDDQWVESCLFENWKRCPLSSIEEWDCFLIENSSDYGEYTCSEFSDEYSCSEDSFEEDIDFERLESGAVNIWKALWWLTPQEALEYMKTTEWLVIIDTRDFDDKPNGFKWALEIPYNQLVKRIEEIPQWHPVLLHCWWGNVAPKGYKALLEFNPEIPELSYIAWVPLFDEYNEWLKKH